MRLEAAAAPVKADRVEDVQAFVRRPPTAKPVVVAPKMPEVVAAVLTPAQVELEGRLRTWRAEEAKVAGLPSFFILSDTVLKGIVVAGPRTVAELRAVRGIEAEKVERFGAAILRSVGVGG